MLRQKVRLVAALASLGAMGCTGDISDAMSSGTPSGRDPGRDPGGSSVPSGAGPTAPPINVQNPFAACDPVIPLDAVRLSDRHLANGIRELLGLDASPKIDTTAGSDAHVFIPNKAAALSGSVAFALRDVVEETAGRATAPGSSLVACQGDEAACAQRFVEEFGRRAFRRPLEAVDRSDLLAVYQAGRAGGGHAGGIRLVIEAALQAPSFLYHGALGAPAGRGVRRVSEHDLATTLSLFLRDSLPDAATWKAVDEGRYATPDGVAAEAERLMAMPEVKANLSRMLVRLFEVDRIHDAEKMAPYELPPALAASMHEETRAFLDKLLWGKGRLPDLLTSRQGFVDSALAKVYGVASPAGGAAAEITLPAAERSGILTQASLLAIHAGPDESSVVHRGAFVASRLLCLDPPPPQPEDLAAGEEIKKSAPTERERAERRLEISRCGSCHGTFDPLGVAFEHYDTLGRYRTTIATPSGNVPVDASWKTPVADLGGDVRDAIDLSARLANSKAVRACVARQVASYALAQQLTGAPGCTTGDLARKFDTSGGDLVGLIRAVTTWDGLRLRKEGVQP